MNTLHLKVHTESNREKIQKIKENRYEIWVKEPAREGKANHRLRELVADIAGVDVKTVNILKGGKSPLKTFIINNDNI